MPGAQITNNLSDVFQLDSRLRRGGRTRGVGVTVVTGVVVGTGVGIVVGPGVAVGTGVGVANGVGVMVGTGVGVAD